MSEGNQTPKVEGLRQMLEETPARDLIEAGPAALARQQAIADEDEPDLTDEEFAQAERFSAMLEAAFLVAASDGELSDAEAEALAKSILELTQNQIPDEDIENLIASYADLLESDGYETRIKFVAEVLDRDDLRQAAFVLAAGIAYADGRVVESEKTIYRDLAQAFQIPQDQVQALLRQVEDVVKV